jgi:RNA polymerase sigma-70 factor, ECF subfamily
MDDSTSRISAMLSGLDKADPKAASLLLPLVYSELRSLAARYMRGERSGQTNQATELVHEAYIRLIGLEHIEWQGRAHFLALAAISMRRILVERARRKLAEKHGGGGGKTLLDEAQIFAPEKSRDLVALDAALTRLQEFSPRQARIVELRFFGGLKVEEIARMEDISPRTVKQDWSLARTWLHHEISRAV